MRDATPTNHVLSVESEGGERVRLEGQLVEEEEEEGPGLQHTGQLGTLGLHVTSQQQQQRLQASRQKCEQWQSCWRSGTSTGSHTTRWGLAGRGCTL